MGSPNIKRTQFTLTLAWASTVHKVQGLSLEQGVVDFDLQKQRSFGAGQIYTALSRVKTYDDLYCIGEFKKSAIKVKGIPWVWMPERKWFIFHVKKTYYFRRYDNDSCS